MSYLQIVPHRVPAAAHLLTAALLEANGLKAPTSVLVALRAAHRLLQLVGNDDREDAIATATEAIAAFEDWKRGRNRLGPKR